MMHINANKFGWASAISFSLVWVVCSFLVWVFPNNMMSISGHMLHINLSNMMWQMSLYSVLLGLLAWAALAGILGWLLATIYNRLL